jgi:hypothetical protein
MMKQIELCRLRSCACTLYPSPVSTLSHLSSLISVPAAGSTHHLPALLPLCLSPPFLSSLTLQVVTFPAEQHKELFTLENRRLVEDEYEVALSFPQEGKVTIFGRDPDKVRPPYSDLGSQFHTQGSAVSVPRPREINVPFMGRSCIEAYIAVCAGDAGPPARAGAGVGRAGGRDLHGHGHGAQGLRRRGACTCLCNGFCAHVCESRMCSSYLNTQCAKGWKFVYTADMCAICLCVGGGVAWAGGPAALHRAISPPQQARARASHCWAAGQGTNVSPSAY